MSNYWITGNKKRIGQKYISDEELNQLDLDTLKKIKLEINFYEEKKKNYLIRKSLIEEDNIRIREKNKLQQEIDSKKISEWRELNWNELEGRIKICQGRLYYSRAGIIKSILGDVIIVNGIKYMRNPAQSLLKELDMLCERREELRKNEPKFSALIRESPEPDLPTEEAFFKIGLHRVGVHLDKINVKIIDDLIEEKSKIKNDEEEKISHLKARASKNEIEKRQQAKKYKSDIKAQISKLQGCPYCSMELNGSNAHLDHIYPVSKGGQSTKRNLVFVCNSCNLEKNTLTLRNFIRKKGLNAELVNANLELLEKDF